MEEIEGKIRAKIAEDDEHCLIRFLLVPKPTMRAKLMISKA